MMHKLTYFPIGGRAFPVRVAMKAAGLPFDDERITGPEVRERKANPPAGYALPLGQLPILKIGEETFCQSTALARYAAKKAGLYSTDDLEALRIDEVTATLDEMWSSTPFGGTPEELKVKREAFMASCNAKYLPYFERRLKESGGPFFTGGDLKVCDLWVFVFVDMVGTAFFDHIPADWITVAYPGLTALAAAVKAHPLVVAHGA